MARQRFVVAVEAELEIDDALLEGVLTDAWRARHEVLHTPEDVAAHLALRLVQDRPLFSIDGFEDQPLDAARLLGARASSDGVRLVHPVAASDPPSPPRGRPRSTTLGGGRKSRQRAGARGRRSRR